MGRGKHPSLGVFRGAADRGGSAEEGGGAVEARSAGEDRDGVDDGGSFVVGLRSEERRLRNDVPVTMVVGTDLDRAGSGKSRLALRATALNGELFERLRF